MEVSSSSFYHEYNYITEDDATSDLIQNATRNLHLIDCNETKYEVSHLDYCLPLPYLPLEVWEVILTFIDSKHYLKMMSLTSKSMYNLVHNKLWMSVTLREPDLLKHIVQFPIITLNLRFIITAENLLRLDCLIYHICRTSNTWN